MIEIAKLIFMTIFRPTKLEDYEIFSGFLMLILLGGLALIAAIITSELAR